MNTEVEGITDMGRGQFWLVVIEERGSKVLYSSDNVVSYSFERIGLTKEWRLIFFEEDGREQRFIVNDQIIAYTCPAGKQIDFGSWVAGRRDK
jgi:hypothetical protein